VEALNARAVAEVALELGAGRRTKADAIDHAVGVVVRARRGERVAAGDLLAEVHAASREAGEGAAAQLLRDAYRIGDRPVERWTAPPEVVHGTQFTVHVSGPQL
jgi:thymidine phosphorylase